MSEEAAPLCECGREQTTTVPDSDIVAACASCSCTEMYVQKDFNRTTGIAIVVIAAAFVPWTIIPLVAVTILDFAIYRFLPDVTVCYACRAVHRGFAKNAAHTHFDLATHDRHVYGAAPPGAEEGHTPSSTRS